MTLQNNPTYKAWAAMRARCLCPTHGNYARYGGRGVTIDARWQSFEAFLADMGPKPDGLSLDRIDGSKGYGPGNCRWATAKEQASNRKLFSTNTSGLTGVSFDVSRSRWRAVGWHNKRKYTLLFTEDFFSSLLRP
jgi:hypothetical protein